jgi:predicted membrane protein
MITFNYKRVLLIILSVILYCLDFYQNYINQTDGDLSRVLTEVSEFRFADFRVHGILLPYFYLLNKLFWFIFDIVAFVSTDGVQSIYLTIAIIKAFYIPVLFLSIVNFLKYVFNSFAINFDFSLIILCTVLIYNQNYGFNRAVGIVNHSFIYFCSYALSVSLMIYTTSVYLLKRNILSVVGMFVFGLFGSVNSVIPLGLFVSGCVLNHSKGNNFWLFLREHKFFLIIAVLLLLIKFFSARYLEVENIMGGQMLPLVERYNMLLNVGLKKYFGQWVFAILIMYLFVQFVLRSLGDSEYHVSEFLGSLKFAFIFTIGYIFVLPFFGYKTYRPDIIKADILTPCLLIWNVFIILIILVGFKQKSCDIRIFLINASSVLLLVIFGYKDRVISNPTMQREKNLLDSISVVSYNNASKQYSINISEPIMFWEGMEKDQGLINRNNIFLRRCGILKEGHSYCLD